MAQLISALLTGLFGDDRLGGEEALSSPAAAAAAAAADPAPQLQPLSPQPLPMAFEDSRDESDDDDDWSQLLPIIQDSFAEDEDALIDNLMRLARHSARPASAVYMAHTGNDAGGSDSDDDDPVWSFVFDEESDDEDAFLDGETTRTVVEVAVERTSATYTRGSVRPVPEAPFWPENYLDSLNDGGFALFTDVSECQICSDTVQARHLAPMHKACGFQTCQTCIRNYISGAIDQGIGSIGRLKCMTWNCPRDINNPWNGRLPVDQCSGPDLAVIRKAVGEEVFRTVSELMTLYSIRIDASIATCPNPKCSTPFATESASCRDVRCPACTRTFCRDCHGPWHAHIGSCTLYQKYSYDQEWAGQGALHDWQIDLKKNVHDAKRCPGCQQRIVKNGGCDHMHCAWCGLDFCWICEKLYAEHDNKACGKLSQRTAEARETSRLRLQFRELRAIEAQRWKDESASVGVKKTEARTTRRRPELSDEASGAVPRSSAASASPVHAPGDADINVGWDDEYEGLAGLRPGRNHSKRRKPTKRWHSSRSAMQRTRDRRFSRGLKLTERESGQAAGLKVRKQAAVLAA